MDIRIPDLAEGVESGTVVNILVKEGDTVRKDQDVLELETKKAVASIPSTTDGKVTKILVKTGDEVAVGQPVISIAPSGAAAPAPAAPAAQAPAPSYSAQPAPAAVSAPAASGAGNGDLSFQYQSKSGFAPPASPTIRRLAKDLGIDLTLVRGSESGGRIVIEDLKSYIQQLHRAAQQPRPAAASQGASASSAPAPVSIDFSKWGPVRKQKMTPIRQAISQQMSASWTTIPHVTQYDEADITDLLALRKKHLAAYDKKGANLTVTSFVLKAVIEVLKKYPIFNASLDEATKEIVFKDYINLGIAVNTEAGLMVPVIRDAQKKNMLELSKDLVALAEKARARKIGIDEMQGGSFTISNQGGIGGAHFTPIINKPEVAILGIGQGKTKPAFQDKKVVARTFMPLCLSYDHRIIDGASAAALIKDLVQSLEAFDDKALKI
jgi:pyruvate dehydrogenase E2 component (dihydrolipoamide acetyltransferase)